MTAVLAASASAFVGAGLLHDALAILIPLGLALLLGAARTASRARAAAAATFAVAMTGLAVVSGGAVNLWPVAPLLAPSLALPFALPGLVGHRIARSRGRVAGELTVLLSWLLVEACFVHLAGIPAFRIGHAASGTGLAPLAGLAGAGTVSAAVWLLAFALAQAPTIGEARHALRVLTPLAGLAAAHLAQAALSLPAGHLPAPAAAGAGPLRSGEAAGGEGTGATDAAEVRVALVQTDVRAADRELARSWHEAETALEERTIELLRRAVAQGADLVVGPEASLRLGSGSGSAVTLPRLPSATPHAVLVGAIAPGAGGVMNAVVDLASGGEVRYVKRHPVPVSERRFSPGARAEPIRLGTLTLAAAICYDVLFARDLRRDALASDLLVAVSDAAFAERSALPSLHLGVARLRAAESGKPLAFVTATGPSALIDGRGRLLARTGRFRPQILAVDVPLYGPIPPYARFGLEFEVFVLAAWPLLLVRRGVRPLADAARRT